ncbi:MAG: restriction endonuclease subunit S [Usitatibacteraceae bacterium]
MDAQQFLAEFGHIAHAPGGVAKLRELVLYLAVSGKLVQQISTEEHAEKLLERMKLAASVVGSKKRGGGKKRLNEQQAFKNHDLPNGWALVALGDLGDWGAGSTPSRSNLSYYGGNIPWFKSGELKSDYITHSEEFVSELALKECSLRHNVPGDVLIAMYGANIGQTAIVGIESTTNQAVCACTPHPGLINRFLLLLLRALQSYFINLGAGGAQPNISKEKIVATTIGLPPTEEQSRIVAKVDELMALCDKLEAQQQDRRKLQNNLRLSTLQTVAAATNPHELQAAWSRLSDNFGWLFHAPEDVDQFVAELKNMAVRGLLSLPLLSSLVIDKIVADCDELRHQYIKSGLMRRQKIIAATETDVTYPEHWVVTPFDKVAIVIGGVTKGRNLRGRNIVTCPYLAVANVQRGFFKLDNIKTIQIGVEELSKYLVEDGDLLITEGGDWDKVGRTAIWRGGVESCLHQNHVFKARVPSGKLLQEWVELVFNSGVGRDFFAGASKQTTNLASINMTQLRSFPLPIPPLAEQIAILEKLNSLTKMCLTWRCQLNRKQDLAALLAGATIVSFVGNTIEQDDEQSFQLPQTETSE